MDIYHIWADKSGDISDQEWVNNMRSFNQFVAGNIQHALYRDWPDHIES